MLSQPLRETRARWMGHPGDYVDLNHQATPFSLQVEAEKVERLR